MITEIDSVNSSVSYTLTANVEKLTLMGTTVIDGTGNTLDNTLTGNSAANSLIGGAGNDTINGGAGNDTLEGGAGKDVLNGGSGADIFKFLNASNVDTITDFSVINDMIQLENAVFISLVNTGMLPVNSFRSGADFKVATDVDDFLIYNSTTGSLYYDAGGNATGSAASLQIAVLGVNLPLTNADFVVI